MALQMMKSRWPVSIQDLEPIGPAGCYVHSFSKVFLVKTTYWHCNLKDWYNGFVVAYIKDLILFHIEIPECFKNSNSSKGYKVITTYFLYPEPQSAGFPSCIFFFLYPPSDVPVYTLPYCSWLDENGSLPIVMYLFQIFRIFFYWFILLLLANFYALE